MLSKGGNLQSENSSVKTATADHLWSFAVIRRITYTLVLFAFEIKNSTIMMKIDTVQNSFKHYMM